MVVENDPHWLPGLATQSCNLRTQEDEEFKILLQLHSKLEASLGFRNPGLKTNKQTSRGGEIAHSLLGEAVS